MKKNKVLLVINQYGYFLSHRQNFVKFLSKNGFDVSILTSFNNKTEFNHAKREYPNLSFYEIPANRSYKSIFYELILLINIMQKIKIIQPNLLHFFGIKLSLIGLYLSLVNRRGKFIFSINGLGYLFTHTSFKIKLLKNFTSLLFSIGNFFSYDRVYYVFQNKMDIIDFNPRFIPKNNIYKINGSGVDTNKYRPAHNKKSSSDVISVIYSGRLLIDKGIRELYQAAENIHKRNLNIHFHIYGSIDNNPNSITQIEAETMGELPNFFVNGHTNCLETIFTQVDIAILPSYREGLPKALLEAAASGLPLIATNVPGCNVICVDDHNGITVPPKSVTHLQNAILDLATDPIRRKNYGLRSRELVVAKFSEEIVFNEFLKVYHSALSPS